MQVTGPKIEIMQWNGIIPISKVTVFVQFFENGSCPRRDAPDSDLLAADEVNDTLLFTLEIFLSALQRRQTRF